MFDIFFMYNTSLNQTRKEKGAAPLASPLQSDHQALSLARGPVSPPPSPGSSTPLGLKITSSTPESIPLTTWPSSGHSSVL